MSEENMLPYHQAEIIRLRNEITELKVENENLRHRFGVLMELVQPILAMAYRWCDAKPGGEQCFKIWDIAIERLWEYWGKHPDMKIPLKEFDFDAYISAGDK